MLVPWPQANCRSSRRKRLQRPRRRSRRRAAQLPRKVKLGAQFYGIAPVPGSCVTAYHFYGMSWHTTVHLHGCASIYDPLTC